MYSDIATAQGAGVAGKSAWQATPNRGRARRGRAGLALLASALLAALLSGCGTSKFLHSAERDKQGQAAKEAWGQVDLKSQIEVPRQNLAKSLAAQIAIEEEIWTKRRGTVAQQMAADWDVWEFRTRSANRLVRVLGGSNMPKVDLEKPAAFAAAANIAVDRAKDYQTAADNAAVAASMKGYLEGRLAILGMPAPPCSIAQDSKKLADYRTLKRKGIADQVLDEFDKTVDAFAKACKDKTTAETKMRALANTTPRGQLGSALKALEDDEGEIETARERSLLLLASLKEAQAAYAAAEKEIEGEPSKNREKIDDALKRLRALVGQLPASANPDAASSGTGKKDDSFATTLFSEERIASINEFLATYDDVVAGKGSPAGSNRFAVALALFPDLQAKTRSALADAEKPRLTPLILTKNLDQAKLDAANRDIERRQAILELRRKIVATLELQMDAYLGAYQAYEKVTAEITLADGKKQNVMLFDALKPIEPCRKSPASPECLKAREEKLSAWRGATRFLEAEGRLRADFGQDTYRVLALEQEGVLLVAESSVQQWKALVDPSVELLKQWGEAGIRSDDLVKAWNSLMLLGIAVGVN